MQSLLNVCDVIVIGGEYCDQVQLFCEFNACVAAEGDVDRIANNVAVLFSDNVDFICSIPMCLRCSTKAIKRRIRRRTCLPFVSRASPPPWTESMCTMAMRTVLRRGRNQEVAVSQSGVSVPAMAGRAAVRMAAAVSTQMLGILSAFRSMDGLARRRRMPTSKIIGCIGSSSTSESRLTQTRKAEFRHTSPRV